VLGSTAGGLPALLMARFIGRIGAGAGRASYAAGPRLGSLTSGFGCLAGLGRNMSTNMTSVGIRGKGLNYILGCPPKKRRLRLIDGRPSVYEQTPLLHKGGERRL
jgi:hypothetical protein